MSKKDDYILKTEKIAAPICEELNFELVDVEFVKEAGTDYLRVYIDKPGGITVDECEIVSRRMNDILDEQDFIEESYIFEVSSPGLGRVLKKDKDFKRSIDQEVEVKLFKPVDGVKEFNAFLKGFDDKTITVSLTDKETICTIDRSNIAKINLAVHF
ncbi:MAG: ribosome maturation factor RimP [Lachnospiraceae bacterium]|nr:ribosome maturation factor RimP [Lachnospiraceae bacterium]